MRIRKVEADVPVPEVLMSVSHLETIYPRVTPEQEPGQPENEVDEVKQTIDEFRKKFEN